MKVRLSRTKSVKNGWIRLAGVSVNFEDCNGVYRQGTSLSWRSVIMHPSLLRVLPDKGPRPLHVHRCPALPLTWASGAAGKSGRERKG